MRRGKGLIYNYFTTTFARLFVCVVVGILVVDNFNIPPIGLIISLFAAFIILTCSLIFKLRSMFLLFWFLFVFSFAGLRTSYQKQNIDIAEDSEKRGYKIEVLSAPKVAENSLRFDAKIVAAADSVGARYVGQNIIVSLFTDSLKTNIDIGYRYLIWTKMTKIQPSGVPYSFDYQRYLRNHNIYTALYLSQNNIKECGEQNDSFLVRLERFRQKMITRYKEVGLSRESQAILSAVTLGSKDLLTKESRGEFTAAGVSHILVVSGMHISYIFLIIMLLYRSSKSKYLQILIIIFGLVVLWLYALFTGFAPAVVRASIMFSIMLLFRFMLKMYKVENALFLAATITTLFSPFQIYDIGFQLSYLAILSIGFFYGKFLTATKMHVANRFVKPLFSVILLTISAQILTAPVVIYNFHQFPLFFIISNIFAALFAPLIFFAGLIVLIPFVGGFLAPLADKIVLIFNYIISAIANTPFSVVKCYISPLDLLLIYLIIASIIYFTIYSPTRKIASLISMICLMIAFVCVVYVEKKERNNNTLLVIPNSKYININIVGGGRNIVYTNKEQSVEWLYSNLWLAKDAPAPKMVLDTTLSKNYFEFSGQSYLILRDNVFRYKDNKAAAFECDNLVIDRGVYPTERLFDCFIEPKRIILTPAVYYGYVPLYQQIALRRGIDFYDIREGGAYIVKE